jgi:hypothetical protein
MSRSAQVPSAPADYRSIGIWEDDRLRVPRRYKFESDLFDRTMMPHIVKQSGQRVTNCVYGAVCFGRALKFNENADVARERLWRWLQRDRARSTDNRVP